jgi:hypothetical protein
VVGVLLGSLFGKTEGNLAARLGFDTRGCVFLTLCSYCIVDSFRVFITVKAKVLQGKSGFYASRSPGVAEGQ